ncbi:hypothetical protein LINPERHAP2_LOCUS7634 [Linum perenne]
MVCITFCILPKMLSMLKLDAYIDMRSAAEYLHLCFGNLVIWTRQEAKQHCIGNMVTKGAKGSIESQRHRWGDCVDLFLQDPMDQTRVLHLTFQSSDLFLEGTTGLQSVSVPSRSSLLPHGSAWSQGALEFSSSLRSSGCDEDFGLAIITGDIVSHLGYELVRLDYGLQWLSLRMKTFQLSTLLKPTSWKLENARSRVFLLVKIMGMSFAYLTKALGRKLLAPLGELIQIGYFDAGMLEGTYVKGRVHLDLFEALVGTVPVVGGNGVTFNVFFSCVAVSCIYFFVRILGHIMAECPRTDLVYEEHIRGPWISIPAEPNEKEGYGPQLQQIQEVRSQGRRGRRNGLAAGRPRPLLALIGPEPVQNSEPIHQEFRSMRSGLTSLNARPLRTVSLSMENSSGPSRAAGP